MSAAAGPGVPSPCIGLCQIDETLGHCLGCGRTRGEIAAWLACDDDEKRAVVRRAAMRRGAPGTRDAAAPES